MRPVVVSSAALPLALDEAVFNPIGFRFDATGPVVDLPASTYQSTRYTRSVRTVTQAEGVQVRTTDYALGAHTASLGLTFGQGANLLPPALRSGVFVGQHGSWNRTEPVGARVMVTRIGADGSAPSSSSPTRSG